MIKSEAVFTPGLGSALAALTGSATSLTDVHQQPLAGVFDQVEYVIKTVRAAVVRVWHHRAVLRYAELGQTSELMLMDGRAGLLHYGQVVVIHDQDQVECIKVSRPYLPGPEIRQIVATFDRMGL